MRKPITHRLNSSIAKALVMPRWHVDFMIKLENGIVRLRKLRPDLSPELIKEKLTSKTQEIYSSLPRANGLKILKTLSEGLYNKACAGEPMPWEENQINKGD